MRWSWIYVLCLIAVLPAMAENQGYRVRSRAQTLIQIARDIYKDERQWKQIAYWNGLKPPYTLSIGQVLILKTPPVVRSKNLIAGVDVNAIRPLGEWPSVERKIVKSGGDLIYVVNERAPSLMMVARDLYGDEGMAKKISGWGGFEPNSKLSLGQRLRLQVPPTKTAAQGTAILIKHWRALGNDLMVERLGGSIAKNERQPAAAAKKSKNAKRAKRSCMAACSGTCGCGATESGQSRTQGGSQIISSTSVSPTSASPAESTEGRQPQSSVGGEPTVLKMKSDSPDGIPTAHKTESYWLGDEAARLLEMLDLKLRKHVKPESK